MVQKYRFRLLAFYVFRQIIFFTTFWTVPGCPNWMTDHSQPVKTETSVTSLFPWLASNYKAMWHVPPGNYLLKVDQSFYLSICFRLKWFKPSLILNPLSFSNANYYSAYLVKRQRKLRSQEVIISTWQYHFDRQHIGLANKVNQTTKWSSFQH